MAKLSRRASSSAATPSTATTATANTGATPVDPSHASGATRQQEEQLQQKTQHLQRHQEQQQQEQQEQHRQKSTHLQQQQQQHQHYQLEQQQHHQLQQQRIARRAASNSNINSNSNRHVSALIDTSPDVLHENPASPSPTPAALSNHHISNSNSNSSNNSSYHSNTATPTAPAHAHVTATPYMPLLPPGEQNLTDAENAAERARIRAEFFATYDVMTGVRIAATLGGFFGLMVFLIVWKSRSSSNETLKVLKDPKMAAVAAVCMQEEEEREIHDAIVATGMSIYPDEYDAMVYRRQRMLSLGNVSAPPLLNRGYRCGSMGGVGVGVPVGYSYLLEPPRRFSYSSMSGGGGPGSGHVGRRKSGSESSRIFSNYPMGGSFGTDDYFVETEDELEAEEYHMQPGAPDDEPVHHQHQRTDSTRSKPGFLSVPMAGQDSRRSSAMTCCSTDSSYLERRTSAYMGGCMGNLPPTLQRKLSTASRTSSIENWDYYYPDIQVIQPTPKASPCPSERSVHEGSASGSLNGSRPSNLSASNIKRKHSIVSYDPDSAQAGRKQQIHSISADTVDVYPYNQESTVDLALPLPKPIQSAPPTGVHQGFHFCDSPSEELRLGVSLPRRKLTLVELQRNESNNNSFPYTANAAVPVPVPVPGTTSSSSISVDSTPVSLERLNGGSLSLATVSVSHKIPPLPGGNNNPEKRAPLASLSSFKISSLECPDSELRSLEEDSVFGLESPADTDDDMQQLSSDSEEQEAAAQAQAQTQAQSQAASKPNPLQLPAKRLPMAIGGGARPRRPLLQRHRTISATSTSDRVALINQAPLQLQQFHMGLPEAVAPPLETHFGAVISQSPPRRGPLLQQYSDPQTTTTTTTTTTTEEDTCSTLNTELGLADPQVLGGGGGGGGGESATHTQYSSLNTVISLGRSTPSPSPIPHPISIPTPVVSSRMDNNPQQPTAQLPTNAIRLVHDPCASSVSDSVIATQQSSICVPDTLKDLILRKAPASGISRSATNLSCDSGSADGAGAGASGAPTTTVMLELPLIRLPNEQADDQQVQQRPADASGEKRDPSLPGTSRKWSKETLF
ncbi:mucin-5AC [Drosophila elegans]|uniref:mucin-5AC n=1 Tax=Drosophila elegans TaxID=30023 RepID=UPI0007E8A789|nr:mucin-5AC [Drosophila elegans]XP_041566100.1 mucin-5AC [Drosophila elegans]XP_041566101.1 mucin-5AC [Drosophila elegans]XP_041566102.1 mucin-5AC [Drosophila elegans]XP_041566103.1 mucin-5AC [Drosophila elegans]XP_041566104.1 mucin-5AC [Drosophila elegans]XP_041566105.1 mucin-5AC [Drosophila elegans]